MAKINRYTNRTPAQFTPRTMEEIMMVPLAKQEQHGKSEEALTKLEDFDYNRLPGDNPAATQELADYRERVAKAAQSLGQSGVGAANRSRILDLNRELKQKMSSTGSWGARKANYDRYAAWTEEMKKKENRGGWSPRQVDTFMKLKTAGFQTQNEDGSLNTFQGSYLPEKVDEIKMFNDLLKNVPDKVLSNTGLKKVGQLDFETIYNDRIVSGKQRKDIFNYIMGVMSNDPKVRESILTSNMLNGIREENPFAVGEEVVSINPLTGEEERKYVAGSVFDAKLFNFAEGAAGATKIQNNYMRAKNYLKIEDMKARIKAKYKEQKERNGRLIRGHDEYNKGVTKETLAGLDYELEHAPAQVQASLKRLNEIKVEHGEDSPIYKNALARYDDSVTRVNNLKLAVDAAKNRGAEGLEERERKFYNVGRKYREIVIDPTTNEYFSPKMQKEALIKELVTKDNIESAASNAGPNLGYAYALGQLSLDQLKEEYFKKEGIELGTDIPEETVSNYEFRPMDTRGTSDFSAPLKADEIEEGTEQSRGIGHIDKSWARINDKVYSNAQEAMDEAYASNTNVAEVIDSDSGEGYNKILNSVLSALEEDNFKIGDWDNSETGKSLLYDIPEGDYYDPSVDNAQLDKVDLSKTQVRLYTGTNSSGNSQFIVSLRNNQGREIKKIFAHKGAAGDNLTRELGEEFILSDNPETRRLGEKLLFNSMSRLTKKSRLAEYGIRSEGIIEGVKWNNESEIKWTKRNLGGGEYDYRIKIEGKPESKPLRSLDEVNAYLYLAKRMTSAREDAKGGWAGSRFEYYFGLSELNKFAAKNKEDE